MDIIYEDGVYQVKRYRDKELQISGRRPYDLQEYSWAKSLPIKNEKGELLFKVFEYVSAPNFHYKSRLYKICYGYKNAIEIMKEIDSKKLPIIDRT